MNEFELRKYYVQFKVWDRYKLSFKAFKAKYEDDSDYRRDVDQGILAYRKPHVQQRVLENSLHLA